MSIARAVLEFCADRKRLGAKTLFATHYHELTELEGTLAGVKNYNIAIKKRGEDLVFLRKIIPGGADRSYGIEVAKLAGLPKEVVSRAKKILEELEAGGSYIPPREEREQVSLDAIGEAEVLDALRRAQPGHHVAHRGDAAALRPEKEAPELTPKQTERVYPHGKKKPLPPT